MSDDIQIVYESTPDSWAAYRDPEGHVGYGKTREAALIDYIDWTEDRLETRIGDLKAERDKAAAVARSLAQELGTERDKNTVACAYAVALQEALKFYADPESWSMDHITGQGEYTALALDRGARARAALAKNPAPENSRSEEACSGCYVPAVEGGGGSNGPEVSRGGTDTALTRSFPRLELGCSGHFIAARNCQWRRHTQVGDYRISSVGDYYPGHGTERETIGAGDDAFFETMVFKTEPAQDAGNEGCGCRTVIEWSGLECERYATAGEAQAGHERYVEKYGAARTMGRPPNGD